MGLSEQPLQVHVHQTFYPDYGERRPEYSLPIWTGGSLYPVEWILQRHVLELNASWNRLVPSAFDLEVICQKNCRGLHAASWLMLIPCQSDAWLGLILWKRENRDPGRQRRQRIDISQGKKKRAFLIIRKA